MMIEDEWKKKKRKQTEIQIEKKFSKSEPV